MANPLIRGTPTTQAGATPQAVAPYSGWADEDLMMVFGAIRDGDATFDTVPGGWTEIPNVEDGGVIEINTGTAAADDLKVKGWYRIIQTGDTSWNWGWTGDGGNNGRFIVVIVQAGTFDPADPFDVSDQDFAAAGGGLSNIAPEVDPTTTEGLLITVHYQNQAITSWATPGGMTIGVAGVSRPAGATFYEALTNGNPTGTRDAVMTGGSSTKDYAAASVVINPAAAAPTTPDVTTQAADNITHDSATLHGTVDPNNGSTTSTFEYDTDSGVPYANSVTADESPITGDGAQAISKVLTGLTPETQYFFEAKGVNSAGTDRGGELSFTTEAAPVVETPTSDTLVIPQLIPTRPQLVPVTHRIISEVGIHEPKVRKDWWSDEIAPGGYDAAQAYMPAYDLLDNMGIYTPGAVWQQWIDTDLIWEGLILDPIIHGNWAELVGRGWMHLAERDADRVLALSRAITDWEPGDSDPYNYSNKGDFKPNIAGGRINFAASKGDNFGAVEGNRVLFYAEDNIIQSLAFRVYWNGANGGGATSDWSIMVESAVGPNGTLTNEMTVVHPVAGSPWTGPDADGNYYRDIDVNINDTAGADLVTIRIYHDAGASLDLTNNVRFWVTDIKVRGISPDDWMQSSELIRVMCSRNNVEDDWVEDSGDNALPFDFKEGTFAEFGDYLSILSGMRWLYLSQGHGQAVCEFADWDKRVWSTIRADGPTRLVPASRYNQVVVGYKTVSGGTRKARVTCDDIDVVDPYATSGWINAYYLELEQKQHTEKDSTGAVIRTASAIPRRIGEEYLRRLVKRRFGGDVERAFIFNEATASYQDARKAHAGDTLRVNDAFPSAGASSRIVGKRNTYKGAAFTMEVGDAAVERYEARRAQKKANSGSLALP